MKGTYEVSREKLITWTNVFNINAHLSFIIIVTIYLNLM